MKQLRALASDYGPDQPVFYLIAERSLSASGRLTLAEWELGRSGGRAQATPPVLNMSDFARKILRFHEQCQQSWQVPTRRVSEIELIAKLRSLDPDLGPIEALAEVSHLGTFEKLGLSTADWREVIEGLEEHKQDPEFSEWTRRILRYLRCKLEIQGQNGLLSPWQHVEMALQVLNQNEAQFWAWNRILSVSGAKPAKIFVVQNCELFPLEKKLIAELKRAQAPIEIVDFTTQQNEISNDAIQTLPRLVPQASSHLVWALFSDSPGSSTWSQSLPAEIKIDVPLAFEAGTSVLCRALKLWTLFFAEGRPRFHAFRQEPAHRRVLTERGMDCDQAPTARDLAHCLMADKSFLRPELLEIQDDTASASDWIEVLSRLQYFDQDQGRIDSLDGSEIDPRGKRIYSLKDLVIGFEGPVLFLSQPEELTRLLSENSLQWSQERILPHRISRLLERAGFTVPEPAREARIHRQQLAMLGPQAAIAGLEPAAPPPREQPSFQSTLKRATYSASSLELLLQCPYKFFARYHIKLNSLAEKDPVKIDPMAQGNWIHVGLEHFFKNPDWKDPVSAVQSALEQKLDEVFAENASNEYRDFLRRQIPNFSQRLARHLTLFESPLGLASERVRTLPEFAFKSQFLGRDLIGKIDRLDILPGNRALLWDYKTGGSFGSTPAALIKTGKIQWFLYKEMVESRGEDLGLGKIEVVGGGFLNPLDPSRSQIYIYPERAPTGLRDFSVAAYPMRQIDGKAEKAIQAALDEQFKIIGTRLDSDIFEPIPNDEKLCSYCEALSACGRPLLSEDSL